MADAKKCDRCGKFYVVVEKTTVEAFSDSVASIIESTFGCRRVKPHILNDLCDDCHKSLNKWWKDKEEMAGENND